MNKKPMSFKKAKEVLREMEYHISNISNHSKVGEKSWDKLVEASVVILNELGDE